MMIRQFRRLSVTSEQVLSTRENSSEKNNQNDDTTSEGNQVVRNARDNLKKAVVREKIAKVEPLILEVWDEIEKTIIQSQQEKGELSNGEGIEKLSHERLWQEVKNVLLALRSMHHSGQFMDRTLTDASQESMISSLKRQLREAQTKISSLGSANKQLDVKSRKLENSLKAERTFRETEYSKEFSLRAEVDSLREELENTKACLLKNETAYSKIKRESDRKDQMIAYLRDDIFRVHQLLDRAQMREHHAKEKVERLERRMARAQSGSAEMESRIKKLQTVQKEITNTMESAQKGIEDAKAARRHLASLIQERTQIVNRITNLWTRGRRGSSAATTEESESEKANAGTENHAKNDGDENSRKAFNGNNMTNNADITNNSDTHITTSGKEQNTNRSRITRKNTRTNRNRSEGSVLNSLRKIGSEFSRNRKVMNSIQNHTEAVHSIVNNDVVALRVVLERKVKDVEQLEEALYEATERASLLEQQLQVENQKVRLRQRVINNNDLRIVQSQRTSATTRKHGGQGVDRRRGQVGEHGTIFEWGSGKGVLRLRKDE